MKLNKLNFIYVSLKKILEYFFRLIILINIFITIYFVPVILTLAGVDESIIINIVGVLNGFIYFIKYVLILWGTTMLIEIILNCVKKEK